MPYKCTACDKSFRYKVSQRSHKCTANPPGTVVRAADTSQNPQQQYQNVSQEVQNSFVENFREDPLKIEIKEPQGSIEENQKPLVFEMESGMVAQNFGFDPISGSGYSFSTEPYRRIEESSETTGYDDTKTRIEFVDSSIQHLGNFFVSKT